MPGILSDAEITAMQATVYNTVLPDTCNVLEQTYTSDGAGGQTIGTAIVSGGSAIACRMDDHASIGQREVIAGAEGVVYPFIFTLPYTAPISADRIIEHNSKFYQIRIVNDDPSWELCARAHCTRND